MQNRAGFIGLGRMGLTHFSILNTHPSVNIVAVCDESKVMLNLFKKYMPNIATFSDFREMIKDTELDFVIVSTPTASHAEVVKFALSNNLHTFVEKPLALNSAQGREILDALGDKRLVNQVGYVNRFNEVFIEVKTLIENNLIGKIKYFRSDFNGPTMLRESRASWRKEKKLGGGCLYEFVCHCIDLIIYLIGMPDKVGESIMQRVYSSDVEDLVKATLIYDKGFFGTIFSNWSDYSFRKPAITIEIFGTEGKILADQHGYKVFLRKSSADGNFHQGWNARYITDLAKPVRFYVRGNEFTRQLDYFVDCIEKGIKNNVSSFSEALKTDIIMEEIAKKATLLPPS